MREAEEFKDHISGIFTRASPTYSRVGPGLFTHFGKRLVKFAGISAGTRVLDVACGRGAAFFPALTAVGASGEVVGIDISDGMIQEIQRDIARRALANAHALKMDAENLEFPDSSFDTILCGLALFFLPDLERALAGFLRVLKPGGQLVASTFQPFDDELSKRWDALDEKFAGSLKPAPKFATKPLNSEGEIRQVLVQAGFYDIEVTAVQKTFYHRNETEWWQWAWSGAYRIFLERMDPDILARYKAQLTELLLETRTEQGIPDTWRLLFSRAKKA